MHFYTYHTEVDITVRELKLIRSLMTRVVVECIVTGWFLRLKYHESV
jgi:hypothetical protein